MNLIKKTIIIISSLIILLGLFTFINLYRKLYSPNVLVKSGKETFFYIKTGYKIEDVSRDLYEKNYIINRNSFEWLAEKKKYSNNIKPGRYKLKDGMSNNELVNLLRSGKQEPVKLSLNSIRTIQQLSVFVGKHLETDSIELYNILNNNDILLSFGVNNYSVMGIFIPNTYEFRWNTSAKDFVNRMYREYKVFWNDERLKQAMSINLTPEKVIILASIVDEESNMYSEFPTLAGVYINRLNKDMPLQADPTVKFALGNFALKRVLQKHTEINSPYNTYIHKGLPPGPICMPSIKAIESVLHYEKHNYLYFCAKSDFSGYHAFSKTLTQHNQNAKAYWRELNKRRINF